MDSAQAEFFSQYEVNHAAFPVELADQSKTSKSEDLVSEGLVFRLTY